MIEDKHVCVYWIFPAFNPCQSLLNISECCYKVQYVDCFSKTLDILPLTLVRFANITQYCYSEVCFLDVVTVVGCRVQNISVHFDYQKNVHFRNGHIVIG
jgi:hypothetical protein